MKNVVLYIALYFISTPFMTLQLGRGFTPPPLPPLFISEEFICCLNSVDFFPQNLNHDLDFFLLIENLYSMNFLSVFTHYLYETLLGTKSIQIS